MPAETRGRPRVVVVTGGTAGVGRAVARRFARAGYRVAVLARGEQGLAQTADELSAMGASCLALQADVSEAEQVQNAALRIERELGPIDVWVNNAMTTIYARVDEMEPREFRRVTDVTYHGYVWGTQAALALMKPRGRGVIVQVGSSLAYRGIALQSAYCGAKHAIRGFTDALRTELLHDDYDIHLCMVQLPAINTPQFDHALNRMPCAPQPVPPIYQPEVAADAIYYAALSRHREVYVGASTVMAIVAQKVMPGVADRFVARTVIEGEMSSEPARRKPSNLFEPVDVAPGAHGRFDGRSRARDPFTAIAKHFGGSVAGALPLLLITGVGMIAGTTALARTRSKRAIAR